MASKNTYRIEIRGSKGYQELTINHSTGLAKIENISEDGARSVSWTGSAGDGQVSQFIARADV